MFSSWVPEKLYFKVQSNLQNLISDSLIYQESLPNLQLVWLNHGSKISQDGKMDQTQQGGI